MPEATLFLAHLDRGQFIHRIVDTRKGGEFGLRSNLATPLGDAFCSHMAEDRAPRLCDDVAQAGVYRALPMQQRMEAASYLGVPLELSDGTRVGSLAALLARVLRLRARRRAAVHDARPRARLRARAREQRARPARASTTCCATRRAGWARSAASRRRSPPARTPAARSARPPARSRARRSRSCSSRRGREFTSTAMAGAEIAAGDDPAARRRTGRGRAFTAKETYFVADARTHPALAAPLVEATDGALRACSSRCCATASWPAC